MRLQALLFSVLAIGASAHAIELTDTLHEVTVTAIKQAETLSLLPVAATTVGEKAIDRYNITSMKDASELVPNFFMPDYGSRMTSSIYVRGIGARMDQPAVGLNVDNVPVLNKNDYDIDLFDIERIEVLRGPQSVLFGRNTMGGLINIYTLSPMRYQGLRLLAEWASHNTWRTAAGIYHKFNDKFALGLDINAYATYGEQVNLWTKEHYPQQHHKADQAEQYAAKLKLAFLPRTDVSIDNVISFNYNRQGGYPYIKVGETHVNYNDTCHYNRTSVSEGLTIQWRAPGFTLSSITGLRYMDDDMTLDQDFTPESYFNLTQAQKEWTLTQDFVARGSKGIYHWMGGIFGFMRHTRMHAPVTMLQDGIQHLIIDNMPAFLNPQWDSDHFYLNSDFTLPVWGLAAYHQSEVRLDRWTLTGALRLDYEHSAMFYGSNASTGVTVMGRPMALEVHETGHLKQHFLELLPKFTATYRLPMREESNLYVSVAKGYKSGGYNTQMFSDILQNKLIPNMGSQPKPDYDINTVTSYKPEKSWNYEIGGHFTCAHGRVMTDLTAFYIDCRDQQLTVFPDGTTTGRMMTNAGRTRSVGAEVSILAQPTSRWNIRATYGFTDARFLRYTDFENGEEISYRGKVLPYAPRHTVFASVEYRQPLPMWWFNAVAVMLDCRAAGPIYWNEDNSRRQDFYALPGASVRLELQKVSLDFWGTNILNQRYDTFYFKSIGNEFTQRGQSRKLGVTLRYIM